MRIICPQRNSPNRSDEYGPMFKPSSRTVNTPISLVYSIKPSGLGKYPIRFNPGSKVKTKIDLGYQKRRAQRTATTVPAPFPAVKAHQRKLRSGDSLLCFPVGCMDIAASQLSDGWLSDLSLEP